MPTQPVWYDGPMIRIRLVPGYDGRDRAAVIWNHYGFDASSAHGATIALSRELIAAGRPDQPWQAAGRGMAATA